MFIFEEKFRKLSYRSENTFLSPENREKRHFSKLFQFWVLHTPGWNLNVYWSKVLNSLYIRIELFLKGCCTFRDIWLFSFKKWPDFWETREKRRFLNFRPPPHICQWKCSLISICSPLQARFNALCTFFQRRIATEISTNYSRK